MTVATPTSDRTAPGLFPPARKRRRRGLRARWRVATRRFSRNLDHKAINTEVVREGGLSTRYVIMCALSAAIATLGMMLSSPAVVIGAMLLSPLMGPIILLGFAFWTVDWPSTRRALVGLAIGIGIGMLVALALTAMLPLKSATPEILARTRPNLVDLMIAVFSGVAGAFAVIHRRGETAIGVAIATAVMPPIAAVGFGLGTGAWGIAVGALLLFATNLVAIAISAAAMAGLYGFRARRDAASKGWIRHAAVLLVLAGLCVPLTVSLRTIALEGRAAAAVRAAVRATFGPSARLASLKIQSRGDTVTVDGLVATPSFVSGAGDRMQGELNRQLHAKAKVRLDQVVIANPATFAAAHQAAAEPESPERTLAEQLRAATPFDLDAVAIDREHGAPMALLSARAGLDLKAAMALEKGLRLQQGLGQALVVPPVQALDPVSIDLTGDAPAPGPEFAAERWALARWRAPAVRATFCGAARTRTRAAALTGQLDKALAPAAVETSRSGRGCLARGPSAAWLQLAPAEPPPPPAATPQAEPKDAAAAG